MASKPKADYPDLSTWLADLDHTNCTMNREGECRGIHCVYCGEMLCGGGFVLCSCRTGLL